jgi:hypothetical protein
LKNKVKDGDEITIDPMEVTKQMLLTCKVMRRRNNNVIPITQIRNNAIKVRENEGISAISRIFESQQESRIT